MHDWYRLNSSLNLRLDQFEWLKCRLNIIITVMMYSGSHRNSPIFTRRFHLGSRDVQQAGRACDVSPAAHVHATRAFSVCWCLELSSRWVIICSPLVVFFGAFDVRWVLGELLAEQVLFCYCCFLFLSCGRIDMDKQSVILYFLSLLISKYFWFFIKLYYFYF